ncbi:MAG: hypothetical protein KAJ10_03625 [Thermodesulfovibrionia bacterium]|nr:hypothetical protein [Thermodesulfovibrionia bacterium]
MDDAYRAEEFILREKVKSSLSKLSSTGDKNLYDQIITEAGYLVGIRTAWLLNHEGFVC